MTAKELKVFDLVEGLLVEMVSLFPLVEVVCWIKIFPLVIWEGLQVFHRGQALAEAIHRILPLVT